MNEIFRLYLQKILDFASAHFDRIILVDWKNEKYDVLVLSRSGQCLYYIGRHPGFIYSPCGCHSNQPLLDNKPRFLLRSCPTLILPFPRTHFTNTNAFFALEAVAISDDRSPAKVNTVGLDQDVYALPCSNALIYSIVARCRSMKISSLV